MKHNCSNCKYGKVLEGFRGSVYFLKFAEKVKNGKIIKIDYSKNECGCRSSERNEIEDECIKNDFPFWEEPNV